MSKLKNRMMSIVDNDRQMLAMQKKFDSALIVQKSNKINIPDNIKHKLDSFISMLSGLNTQKDNKTHYTYSANRRLSYETRKEMYRSSGITRVIINSIVDEALKKTLIFDHGKKDEFTQKFKDFKIKDFMKRAMKEARTHGMAAAFYFINDGQPSYIPVKPERIRDIKPLFVLNKEYLTPLSSSLINPLIPIKWEPGMEIEFYQISYQGKNDIYHKSRVLEFYGEYAGEDEKIENRGFPESIIDSRSEAILLYELINSSVTTLSDRAIQEIVKINGLEDKLHGNIENVLEQIIAMMMGKSVVNRILLDVQDTYEYHSANLTGYIDLQKMSKDYLASVDGTPKTKLFGDSPSGGVGSQTGSYEEDVWKDKVSSYQSDEIEPQVDKVVMWVKALLSIPINEIIIYKFPSLYEMTPKQQAEIREIDSRTFTNYISYKVLKPETVALSLFEGEYSSNIQIDDKTINDMKKTLSEPSQKEFINNIESNNNVFN